MKNLITRGICLALTLVLAFSLTACGGNKPAETTPTTTVAPTTEPTTEPEPTTPVTGPEYFDEKPDQSSIGHFIPLIAAGIVAVAVAVVLIVKKKK